MSNSFINPLIYGVFHLWRQHPNNNRNVNNSRTTCQLLRNSNCSPTHVSVRHAGMSRHSTAVRIVSDSVQDTYQSMKFFQSKRNGHSCTDLIASNTNVRKTRHVSSMIHSARPTVPPVFSLELCFARF